MSKVSFPIFYVTVKFFNTRFICLCVVTITIETHFLKTH